GGVVDRDGVTVVDQLGIALFGLKLQADAAVTADPPPSRAPGHQWVGGDAPTWATRGAGQFGAFNEMVGQRDRSAEAFVGAVARARQSAMDRLCQGRGRP